MAHLMVTSETVVVDQPQQENSENRSIGKHKRRDDMGLTCLEPSAWPCVETKKRRALAPITNRQDWYPTTSSKGFGGTISKKPLVKATSMLAPTLHDFPHASSSFPPCDEDYVKPIGSEMSFSGSDSRMSVTFSSSFRSSVSSMESTLSFDSPMLVSSPDFFNTAKLKCKEFVDIDLGEGSSCSTGQYASEIFAYLRNAEARFHPNPQYMKKQPDITEGMRSILVDWLVEVAEEFKLDQQTLHMSITIVDRFLSSTSVMRSKLQLVGATAIYIASKFEEIFPPELADFTYITDDTYTKVQIVRMERLILKVLDFNLAAPTSHTFVLRYLKASDADLRSVKPHAVNAASLPDGEATSDIDSISQAISSLSMYLCELALQDIDPHLKYYPSVVAASAVCLARHTMAQLAWPRTLEHYSGYTVSDIGNCVQDLHRTLALAPQHAQQAIRQKYSSHAFQMISSIKAPETLPC